MTDFVGQTFSEESNESKIKHIRSIPVDSAYFCLHLVFEVEPVPIAIGLLRVTVVKVSQREP